MTVTERAAKVLQEINFALAEADNATPGPWRTWGTTVVAGPGIDVADAITVASTWQRSALGYPRTGDSNFIAASRTGWPKALRSLKTAIEGLLSVMPPCPTLEPSPLLRDHVAACLTTLCDQWEA